MSSRRTARSPYQTVRLLVIRRTRHHRRLQELRVGDPVRRPGAGRLEAEVEVRREQDREERRLGRDHEDHSPPAERPAGGTGGNGGDASSDAAPREGSRAGGARTRGRAPRRRARPGRATRGCRSAAPRRLRARARRASGVSDSPGISSSACAIGVERRASRRCGGPRAGRGRSRRPRAPTSGSRSRRRGSARSCTAAAARSSTTRASRRPTGRRPPARRRTGARIAFTSDEHEPGREHVGADRLDEVERAPAHARRDRCRRAAASRAARRCASGRRRG